MELVVGISIVALAQLGSVWIEVGSIKVKIPAPEGYVRVTDDMEYEARMSGVLDRSSKLNLAAWFVHPDLDSDDHLGDFTVEFHPDLNRQTTTVEDFQAFMALMKEELVQVAGVLDEEAQRASAALNEELGGEFGENASIELGAPTLFDIHDESTHTMSYSKLMPVATADETSVIASTLVYANVGGSVLIFMCNGAESDLEWTRQAADAWVDEVLASNRIAPRDADLAQDANSNNFAQNVTRALFILIVAGIITEIARRRLRKAA